LDRPFEGDAIPYPFEDEAGARAAVIDRARELVRRVQRWFPEWTPPPFNPWLYAEMSEMPVIECRMPADCDALFVPIGESFTIILNDLIRSRGRRNFSLAHEIVHSWFVDRGDAQTYARARQRDGERRFAGSRSLERLCDVGASELIMPFEWFRAALERRGLAAESVPGLARDFDVSLEAAALRVVEVSPVPCAVALIEAREDGRSPTAWPAFQPAWSTTRARVRRVFAPAKLRVGLHSGGVVPADSILRRAVDAGGACEGVEHVLVNGRPTALRVSVCGTPDTGEEHAPRVGIAVLTAR
jgi:Zn-dependent peptidase ImmA (M78 family)